MSLLVAAGVIGAGVVSIPVILQGMRYAPYAYINARVRSLRGRMLNEQELITYSNFGFNEVIAHMVERGYPRLTTTSKDDLSYPTIERALREHTVAYFIDLQRMSPKSVQPFVKAFTQKWDIQNIVTLFRARVGLQRRAENLTRVLIPTKLFTPQLIRELAETKTPDQVRQHLTHTPYEPLLSEYWSKISNGELKQFEEALDKKYFRDLKKHAKGQYSKQFIKILIDVINIKTLLRGEQDILVPGGSLKLKGVTKDSLRERVNSTRYLYALEAKDDFEIERRLDCIIKHYGNSLFRKEPLSEAPVVGFLITKELESKNLRMILRMTLDERSQEEIESLLITDTDLTTKNRSNGVQANIRGVSA